VGKTTLASGISEFVPIETVYLDLELDSDLAKLADAKGFLNRFDDIMKCCIIQDSFSSKLSSLFMED
jgi:hypothetical protein